MQSRKLKLYIACSLNGYIADADGSVAFLEKVPNPEGLDYGYATFYDTIDTTIQGFTTYQQIIEWDIPFPYQGKKNYVFTNRKVQSESTDVTFVTEDHAGFLQNLKKQDGGDIWLIGGGRLNQFCLDHGLIDEMNTFIMPILLPNGIPMFAQFLEETDLKLISQETYSNGVVRLNYKLDNGKI
ncbi:MAG: dihydrofolate reductase [Saprospiraceae bacterium]|nr:dihydrofolate reductase [Saprospiraceae bacterium]